MNISTQIITVLDDLCRRFGLAIDWTEENIMPYLQELAGKYISWEMATSWMWIAVGALCVVVGIAVFAADLWKDRDGIGAMIGGLVFVAGVIVIGCQVHDILTCIHFPEKMIVDYITFLMESH